MTIASVQLATAIRAIHFSDRVKYTLRSSELIHSSDLEAAPEAGGGGFGGGGRGGGGGLALERVARRREPTTVARRSIGVVTASNFLVCRRVGRRRGSASPMTVIVTGTLIYFSVGVGVTLISHFIPACKSDQSLSNLLIWLTICCMWLMWVITYMMQLYPLIAPIPIVEAE